MTQSDSLKDPHDGNLAASSSAVWWKDLAETLLPAIAVVLAINLFLAQPRVVHGQSMEPNLHENQRLIIDLVTYRFRSPARGEIVVLSLHDRQTGPPLIKRVVGLAGDTVEIKQGAVYINGRRLDEPYLGQVTPGTMPPKLVPEAHVFVLGDNRSCSNDSRYFGMVPFEDIVGRAWVRYWPVSALCFFT